MSKEAVGQCGEVVGSSGYWAKLNRGTLFVDRVSRVPDYRAVLTRFGHRAKDAIDEVYSDLSNLAEKLRYLPQEDRNALAKQVEELYDVCRMSGVSATRASDCIHGLNLSIMSPWNRGIRNERDIERALAEIKNFRFSDRTTVDLLREAGRWGISSAAGRDEKKRTFLQSIADIDNSDRFFTAVAEEYQHQTDTPKYEGHCGYSVGSRAYRTYLEVLVFDRSISGLSTVDYAALLRDELSDIAQQLERDLDVAQRNRDYITQFTAGLLHAVIDDLDHLNVRTGTLSSKADKLLWYAEGDQNKVRELQRTLNDLDPSLRLKEDGVLGDKTEYGISKVTNRIAEFLTDPDKMRKLGQLITLIKALDGHPYNLAKYQIQKRFSADIMRAIWKLGAKCYLRPRGYDVAALLLEHSLETSPSNLYFTQTHWVTQTIMRSQAFENGFAVLEQLIRKAPDLYADSGSFTVNFQETGETDLYYGIGKATISYTCVRGPSEVYVTFVLEDTYDFDNFRTIYGEEGDNVVFNIAPGSLANDFGLLSQAGGVITPYRISIRFQKTITL